MPANHFVGNRQKPSVRAVGAFDLRFLAYATHPLVRACRGVTDFVSLATLKPAGINVLSPAEQRSKQFDLGGRRRLLSHALANLTRRGGAQGIVSINGNWRSHIIQPRRKPSSRR